MAKLLDKLAAQEQLGLDTVRSWLRQYGGGDPASLQLAHCGFGLLYRVAGPGTPRQLRVSALRSAQEVEASLDYLRHLHSLRAPVCAPLPWPDGRFVRRFEHEGTAFHASWLERVPGEPIGRDSLDAEAHYAWGRAMARLHDAAARYRPPARLRFLHWRDQLEATRARISPGDGALLRELHWLEGWLTARAEHAPYVGLTHGDMNAGNAIWDGHRVVLIDFEEPCWHLWAADVARPLREMTTQSVAERQRLCAAIVAGYRSERTLDEDQLADLDSCVRFKNLEILMWRRADQRADPEDPDMVTLLRAVLQPLALRERTAP